MTVNINRTSPPPAAPVAELLRRVRENPDEVALIAAGQSWSVAQLSDLSARLAAGLASRGVGPGHRVALHLHNGAEAALLYLACFRLGATAAPLNTRLTSSELADLTTRTRPALYVGAPDLYDAFAPVDDALVPARARFLIGEPGRGPAVGSWRSLFADDGAVTEAAPPPDAPAVLLPTSGTTGPSKIVVWSYRTLANLHLSAAGRGIVPGGVIPILTPLMHGAAVYYLLNALTQRAVPVLIGQFEAGTTLDAIVRHRVTNVFGLPFMCGALAREQQMRPRDISSLRSATVAGDVCPAEVEVAFKQAFGVPLRSYWAAAEDVGATVTDEQVGPYMRLIAEADARVVDDTGAAVAHGDVGELIVRSPTTSPGYWINEAEVDPLPDRAFRSGDLVRRLGPDRLAYVGRLKDLIVRGGSNVSPVEIEAELRQNPAVADVGVAGYPDPDLGQRVGAVLVGHPGRRGQPELDPRQVMDWLASRLAAYKIPERVLAVDAVPRNGLTKVDRAAVTQLLLGRASSSRP